MSTQFWKHLKELLQWHHVKWYCELPLMIRIDLGRIVAEAIPTSSEWGVNEIDPNLPALLTSLYTGSDAGWQSGKNDSPAPSKFLLENIAFHIDEASFEELLYQVPPRGAITFGWDTNGGGEDGFWHPGGKKERLVSWIRNKFWFADEGHIFYDMNATIGFIRVDQLELFAFPVNYPAIIERVHRNLGQMTAKEKAQKELGFVLKQFVRLLGHEAVHEALENIK